MSTIVQASAALPTRESVREWFPSLKKEFVFLENAGGSQVPRSVPEAMHDYMLESYVQVGAGYPASVRATEVVAEAHRFVENVVNAGETGKVVLGPSTTALCHILANAYGQVLTAGDEVVISEIAHESNAGPWEKLARFGVEVKTWKLDLDRETTSLDGLKEVLSERTKIVAFPQVSNLLGEVLDVEAVCDLAHLVGARVVCDGVAYAPHGPIDVQAWGVDWYVYSCYKVYGPHMAALFGTHEAFSEITGPNHFFIPKDSVPSKFELGGCSHEGCAGLLGMRPYLSFLAGREASDRAAIEAAFSVMNWLEAEPKARLLGYLRGKSSVRVLGNPTIGTVSFLHSTMPSPQVVAEVDRAGIGIRFGHMYAYRLCQAMEIDPETGVVRVSLVHYNTSEEIDRLIEVFEQVL